MNNRVTPETESSNKTDSGISQQVADDVERYFNYAESSKPFQRIAEYEELFFNYAETGDQNPPYINKGGTIPTTEILTHSASTPPYKELNCHVDYLSFTNRISDDRLIDDYIGEHLGQLTEIVPDLVIAPESKGYSGYTSKIALKRKGANIGLIAYGGNNGTMLTSFSGQGCVGMDMQKMHDFVQALDAKLTRVDMAHDDLDGLIPVAEFKAMYDRGDFRPSTGGHNPGARYIDDMGTGNGCTLYVGSKQNGKELCIYEKGKQLGDLNSKWVRVEGRVTCEDRVIPYDILLKPDEYLAGLYMPLRELADKHSLIAVIKKHAEIALKAMVENCSMAYGKLVNLMSELGHTDSEIVESIRREGIPSRVKVPMDLWAAQYVEDDRVYLGQVPLWMRATV